MKKNYLIALLFVASFIVVMNACSNDKAVLYPRVSDTELFNLANKTGGFHFYKNSTDTLTPDAQSAHSYFRLRFNDIAFSVLDTSGKISSGETFPDGSLIVKELYSGLPGNFQGYAIMYKQPEVPNSSQGWVWGEYLVDGSSSYSANNNGAGCVSCHSGAGNRDRVRTFSLHP